MSILTSGSQSQQQFYEQATDYSKSLNSKFPLQLLKLT